MENIRGLNGISFQMGVGVDEVSAGDVIRVSSGTDGDLEKIAKVVKGPRNSWTVQTESGRTYDAFDIYEYGKRICEFGSRPR